MGGTAVDSELATFVAAERQRLVGMLALYVGDERTAEELAQDAIVRLCQHWPRVRRMSDPRAWLNRVAINLANSWFRRRAAERRATIRRGSTDEVVHESLSTTIVVRELVASLPPRQRAALVLRYYVGMSVAETAAAMGCAEGTVKALAHRAIGALRASLEPEASQEVPHA